MNNWGINRFISKEIVFFSLIIYLIGYMHWSITWLILPIFWNSVSVSRRRQIDTMRDYVRVPASFPAVEKAEWLNKIVEQFWPSISSYAKDIIHVNLEEKLKQISQKYFLTGFTLGTITLGKVPFRTEGVIVYNTGNRDEVVMDVDIAYAGDCYIKFLLVSVLIGGLKNFQIYGKLRIELKLLNKSFPQIEEVQFFFWINPDVKFELVGMIGILKMSGINETLTKLVKDTISSSMVLPNRFSIYLSK